MTELEGRPLRWAPGSHAGPLPWVPGDLGRAAVAIGLGLCAILGAWLGTSGTTSYSRQVEWTALGGAGVIAEGLGIATWMVAGMGRVRARQRSIGDLVRLGSDVETAEGADAGNAAARLVAAPGMTYFHRADCQLASGKAVSAASREAHRRAGRRECGVCQP